MSSADNTTVTETSFSYLTRKGRLLKERLVPLAEDMNRVAVEGIAPEHVAITRRRCSR